MPKTPKHPSRHTTRISKKETGLEMARRAYAFFDHAERNRSIIELSEICTVAGYTLGTVSSYATKKWWWFLHPHTPHGYTVQGLHKETQEYFLRIHRQKSVPDPLPSPSVHIVVKEVPHYVSCHWRLSNGETAILIGVMLFFALTARLPRRSMIARWKRGWW